MAFTVQGALQAVLDPDSVRYFCKVYATVLFENRKYCFADMGLPFGLSVFDDPLVAAEDFEGLQAHVANVSRFIGYVWMI